MRARDPEDRARRLMAVLRRSLKRTQAGAVDLTPAEHEAAPDAGATKPPSHLLTARRAWRGLPLA